MGSGTGPLSAAGAELIKALPQPQNLPGTLEEISTGAVATSAKFDKYHTEVITGGSQAAETYNFGDGAGLEQGHRKVITLKTLTDPADSVVLDHANFSQGDLTVSAIELDAEDEFLFAELRGSAWEILFASAGVVTAV